MVYVCSYSCGCSVTALLRIAMAANNEDPIAAKGSSLAQGTRAADKGVGPHLTKSAK